MYTCVTSRYFEPHSHYSYLKGGRVTAADVASSAGMKVIIVVILHHDHHDHHVCVLVLSMLSVFV